MIRRHRPAGGGRGALHLLEVDVRWPPETFLCWKLEGLAARGLRVTVASRSIVEQSARLDGVELVPLPQRGQPRMRRVEVGRRALALGLRSPRRLARLLRGIRRLPTAYRHRYGGAVGLLPLYLPVARLRPDIVHFEWNHGAAAYQPMFGVWRCPIVISCHGKHLSVDRHLPGYEAFAALLPALLRSATRVHCVSDSQARLALELGVPAQRVNVIRQGIDTSMFRPRSASFLSREKPLDVLAVGWPRWVKGFEWALQAVRILLETGVPARLQVLGAETGEDVGERAERERLRHTVSDLGLGDHVRLRGRLATPAVARTMRESDVLIVPSLEEGLPTVVLEAMASGVPIVATDCGGTSEALTHGREGLLVQPRDAVGLARALERLWGDPALRARMGEAARRTAISRFTLERQLREFYGLYLEVARGLPGPAHAIGDAPQPERGVARQRNKEPGLHVLSAGSLTWQHGFEHGVHAIRLLLDAGVCCSYRILGEGEHLPAIAFARHQLELADHVELRGWSPDDGLAEQFGWADVLLDPSVADGTSCAALEAARVVGLPLVTTNRRTCSVHPRAVVVPRRDPVAIARALDMLARRPRWSASAGALSRNHLAAYAEPCG